MTELIQYREQPILATYSDIEKAAAAMAASGYFSDAKQAAQAVVKILAAAEIGMGPFAGMSGIYIINNKPSISANLMAAAIKRSGRYNYRVTKLTDIACAIDFFEISEGKWVKIGTSEFDIDAARKAGTKNLATFPRNMLFARAMSNGVRWYCPDVMNGSPAYTPEELGATVNENGEVISVETVVQADDAEYTMDWESDADNAPETDDTKTWDFKTRPYDPATLREALKRKAASAKPATDKQRNLLNALLNEYFGDKIDTRYQATEYLVGVKHKADIPAEMVSAMLNWMEAAKASDGSGTYTIGTMASKELALAGGQFMAEQGQETLL